MADQIANLDKKFLKDKVDVGIEISATKDPAVLAALANDTPFPKDTSGLVKQVDLGDISAKAQTGKDIVFGSNDQDKVSFSAKAEANSGIGVYPNPSKLLDKLSIDDSIAPGMDLENDPASFYMALRWGYDVAGSAKGSLALGAPGAVTFGAQGEKQGLYAVVRRFPNDAHALTSIKETVSSWKLPSQVDSFEKLKPGTWLVAEVSGSIALSLGVKYGYDFNWVRQTQLGGLSGDISLRVQMAVSASLGFSASGKYCVILSRDSMSDGDESLRLRLFKQRQKGWNFAFDAGATVQGDFSKFLPAFPEFVKAVMGVHAAQVLKELEKWTDPNTKLSDLFLGATDKYVEEFVKKVAGLIPTDFAKIEDFIKAAKDKLNSLLDKWKNLDHKVAIMLMKLIQEGVGDDKLKELSGIVNQIVTFSNQDSLKNFLKDELSKVGFFDTPFGEWLSAAATDGILNAVNSIKGFNEVHDAAVLTSQILDGSAIENLLKKLQSYIDEKLNLDKLKDIIDQASVENLDDWLKAKIKAFLGKAADDVLKFEEVDKVRTALNNFLSKGKEFYDKTVKALNHKYNFHLTYTYQSTTTGTALLDIVFDFKAGQANEIRNVLKEALSGQYDEVFLTNAAGVRFNAATLTHQIERHAHTEITLPFFNSTVDEINQSLATVNRVDSDEGRVFLYELDAKDIIIEKGKRDSQLSIAGHLPIAAGNQVRTYKRNPSTDPSRSELSYSYSFRQIKKGTTLAELQHQLSPYAHNYFRSAFGSKQGTDPDTSFVQWLATIDQEVGQLDSSLNIIHNMGTTLTSLEISVPAAVTSAWLKAPANKSTPDAYMRMSVSIQKKLKELIPFYYFQNLKNYGQHGTAEILLVYAAIPAINADAIAGQPKDYYWNFEDPDVRRAIVKSDLTKNNLIIDLTRVHDMLSLIPGMQGTAAFYEPKAVEKIQTMVADDQRNLLLGLLFAEAEIIKHAIEAGDKIAKFISTAPNKPSEAIKALAEFGSKITGAFNKDVTNAYIGGAFRPMGTALFIEAAKSIDPSLANVTGASAMLNLTVLKPQAQIPDYLNGDEPEKKDILTSHPLVNL